MVLTQQIIVEALKLFMKYLPQIEKFPKMTTILRNVFDFEKQFYRINYTNEYLHMVHLCFHFRLSHLRSRESKQPTISSKN
jgi:hypothetical protein